MEKIEKKGRQRLINYILSYAGDEIETKEDYLKLAFLTLRDLEQNVKQIKAYLEQNVKQIKTYINNNN